MAIKVYSSGGVLVIEETGKDLQIINSALMDWQINNGTYTIRDGVQNQSFKLGLLANITDKAGNTFATDSIFQNYLNQIVSKQNTGVNALAFDAWGRNKTYHDKSILHGMFTFNVPVMTWKEKYNGTERTPTNATSENGSLKLVSGVNLNDITTLETFRHPRYQPNRGHLYSTAMILPSKTALGVREFGIFTEEAGAFFRLKSNGKLYAVTRTTINSVLTEDEKEINTTLFDIEKGNVYDIQFQWRGVGNYVFFINLQKVASFDYLGTLTRLSMFNPALPIAYSCKNLGANVIMYSGCVDVTSEGGDSNGKTYGSISLENQSGQIAITGYNVPILAVRSKLTVDSKRNTRDTLALLLSAFSDVNSFVRVWETRDFTAITPNQQAWKDYGDGHLEYITYDTPDVVTPMTFDTAKATNVFGCRVSLNSTYSTSALFEGRTEVWLPPGSMFVFTIHRENGQGANVGCTFEFAEEI